MAKIIASNESFNQMTATSYRAGGFILVGAIMGIIYLLAYLLFNNLFIAAVADGLAMITTLVISVVTMVLCGMVQPLTISLSVGLSLWGVGSWSNGLLLAEMAVWCVLLFLVAYLLFSKIVSCFRLGWAILIILLIVTTVRIVVGL
jgi:hypothetical protein